ncbi:hypothetical protein BJF79_07230 [Actinomadura sp. CNU-125]|nr:hypothetical protein BJF79_07230 [Actinomadura sp. CNU-125]
MIAVERLKPHPEHVRAEVDLNRQFLASIAATGVIEALHVTPDPEGRGGFLILEGHRRWAAACKVGVGEVPCDVDAGPSGDAGRQHLVQYIANDPALRTNHSPYEQTQALTLAAEAGASRTEIRKATGLTAVEVKQVLKAGRLGPDGWKRVRETVAEDYELTVPELAILAEFQDDEEATGRLLAAARYGEPLEAVAGLVRRTRAEEAEHRRLVEQLTGDGVAVSEELPDGAVELGALRAGEDVLEAGAHGGCPGRGAWFPASLTEPVHYCTDPIRYGHAFADPALGERVRVRGELAAAGENVTEGLPMGAWRLDSLRHDGRELTGEEHRGCPGAGVYVRRGEVPEPVYYCRSAAAHGHTVRSNGVAAAAPGVKKPEETPRRDVVRFNREWATAAEHRRKFLSQLLRRRSAPKGTAAFVTGRLLEMPTPVPGGLGSWRNEFLFTEFTGKSFDEARREAERAATGRLHTLLLAQLAAAFEYDIADVGGKVKTDRSNTWRTDDRTNPYCSRTEAAVYLEFLVACGYEATAIEKAVIAGARYTGIDPAQTDVEKTAQEAA